VCFYDGLQEPAHDYNICDCCGTEFGNDDELLSSSALRERWVEKGAKWFFGEPPANWQPWVQLLKANVPLPYPTSVTAEGGGIVRKSGGAETEQWIAEAS